MLVFLNYFFSCYLLVKQMLGEHSYIYINVINCVYIKVIILFFFLSFIDILLHKYLKIRNLNENYFTMRL